ncbi:transglutaminase domain-containing protein [Psychroserpens ponticola]|uniref:Transglutaminase domain-containing protein n=1 Tax=Psychroserpens ponticola TaxID=2932268 RepID=A0ABY7RUZ5_9FLAO|nr:transglutaminase domain-containing protein [Psychroserpens ponticola]WCO00959.1 transglutaminase domain-containing protein [Psychroserpens ponticola]
MKRILLFIIFICNIINAQRSDFNTIDFTRADNIAELNANSSLNNLPALAYKLTSKLPTEVEKFRAIYTWVCNNIVGDPSQHNTVSSMRRKLKNDSIAFMNWNNDFRKQAFKKLLKQKKTMCTGYAYLIKELCYLSGIESEIIDGYARSVDSNVEKLEDPNHSWTAVNLNNKWYLCDATWSSGYMISESLFVKEYNGGYFLAEPVLFAKSHYPLQKKWLLDDTLIQEDFVAGPLVYGETFIQNIIPFSPKKMNIQIKKNTEINFSLKSLKQISNKNISLIKLSNQNEKVLEIYDIKSENGWIQFKHQFKHRGQHDVHLKINNDIVATYTINVTKS